jgi:membrane fusion protein, multidrug efflux system
MTDIDVKSLSENENNSKPRSARRARWLTSVAIFLLAGGAWFGYSHLDKSQASAPAATPPSVTVSRPLVENVNARLGAIGQFSAVDRIELRAQVGGTLSEIHFKDGQIVHQGDLLFVIDPRPYEIKLAEAKAALESAQARLALAKAQLSRTKALRPSGAVSADELDARVAEQRAAEAAIDDAKAGIRDAELDLEYSRVTAPFSGRIGARQVSIGDLIAGSRAAASPTTLLATLVSLDPIYLDFDMSEQEYLAFLRGRQIKKDPIADTVDVSLSDETTFTRQGTLDFVDNALDRSSGTIHARATVPNPDLFLAPGQFGRVRLALTPLSPALLVPDAAVLADQADHIVLTLGPKNVVTPKRVEIGELINGLRIIRSGLAASDQIIIDGIPIARPGSQVIPNFGAITAQIDQGQS